LLQVVEAVVVVTLEVEVQVDLEKAQLQACPGRTQLLLELAVVAPLDLTLILLPPQQHLKKVETLLLLEVMFQLPQLAEELVQEEVNQYHQMIEMVVLVVEVIASRPVPSLAAYQEQELLVKVLVAEMVWVMKGSFGLAVAVVVLVVKAERRFQESVVMVAPVKALQYLAFQ
jgi:hypothetical protein